MSIMKLAFVAPFIFFCGFGAFAQLDSITDFIIVTDPIQNVIIPDSSEQVIIEGGAGLTCEYRSLFSITGNTPVEAIHFKMGTSDQISDLIDVVFHIGDTPPANMSLTMENNSVELLLGPGIYHEIIFAQVTLEFLDGSFSQPMVYYNGSGE